MLDFMVVVVIHLSTSMSIIATITIITKEIPLTRLITISIKGISILLVKGDHAPQHHKLVADQGLQLPTGRQQNLQHHQGEPKVEPHHLIGPPHLIERQRRRLAGHQHHKQDHHHRVHQIGHHLHHRDHPHHHALRAQAVRAEVAEVVEDDKFFLY
jgi:hypothetical protein